MVTRKGISGHFDSAERSMLRDVFEMVLERLEQEGQSVEPGANDPLTARLFPDAYPFDPEASAEFRRLTQTDLNAEKIRTVKRSLKTLEDRSEFVLDDSEADSWLRAFNDARLILSVQLGIGSARDAEELEHEVAAQDALYRSGEYDQEDEDHRLTVYRFYQFLGWLQESLTQAVLARLSA